jgi:hypothetical protein
MLSGDLVLRDAIRADLDAIVTLETAAFGEQDAPQIRTYFDHFGADHWTVVLDGDRLVSACARIPHVFALDGVEFNGAQIEYVATEPGYQRRGLVRAQFERHHERSAAAGDLAQFVGGIPYFYRLLGYGYGLDHPLLYLFDPGLLRVPDDVTVRAAVADDLDALVELEHLRRLPGLRTVRNRDRWRLGLALAMSGRFEELLVAEADGALVGWARLHRDTDEGRVYLLPSAAASAPAVDALVAAAIAFAGDDLLVGYDAPGTTFGRRSAELGTPVVYDLGIYTRIADPVALLDHLRPLLSERLRSSELGDHRGELRVSLYTSGLAITYDSGEVTSIAPIAPIEDPTEEDAVGVAPDCLGALVFGRYGAIGLAERADDVLLGGHRRIMEVLFPKRPSDVAADL